MLPKCCFVTSNSSLFCAVLLWCKCIYSTYTLSVSIHQIVLYTNVLRCFDRGDDDDATMLAYGIACETHKKNKDTDVDFCKKDEEYGD